MRTLLSLLGLLALVACDDEARSGPAPIDGADDAAVVDGAPPDADRDAAEPGDLAVAPDGAVPDVGLDMITPDMAAPDMASPDPPARRPDGRVVVDGECDPRDANDDRPGARCTRVRVEVAGLPDIHAELRFTGDGVRGAIVFGSGTGGGGWTLDAAEEPTLADLMRRLAEDGFTVIERRWDNAASPGGWFGGGAGGMTAHAARYALLARWIRTEFVPDGGALCVTGNSGGSAELGYALAWDLGTVADLVVPTSGPIDALPEACWGELYSAAYAERCEAWWSENEAAGTTFCRAGRRLCALSGSARDLVSISFGPDVFPCGRGRDGPAAPTEADLALLEGDPPAPPPPGVVVRVLLGYGDCSAVVPQGAFWAERLAASGVDATWRLVPDTPHNVLLSPTGVFTLETILAEHCH